MLTLICSRSPGSLFVHPLFGAEIDGLADLFFAFVVKFLAAAGKFIHLCARLIKLMLGFLPQFLK